MLYLQPVSIKMNPPSPASPPSADQLITCPAFRFHQDSEKAVEFLRFAIKYAARLESLIKTLATTITALPEENKSEIPTEQHQMLGDVLTGNYVGSPLQDLKSQFPFLFELIFCRCVDNFLNYISELIALTFSTHPEMLKSAYPPGGKSEEKVSVEWVLQYADRFELVDALTERKVMDLSMKGMTNLQDYCKRNFKFEIYEDATKLEQAAIAVEKRNLITHNRGYVNRRYLERVRSVKESLGDRMEFDGDYVLSVMAFLRDSVHDIDDRAANKFRLDRKPRGERRAGSTPAAS